MQIQKIMKIIVNSITTLRLIFTIYLMVCFSTISSFHFILMMILLFLTDFIDGKMARYFGVQTMYGCHMDTIADKVLSIGLMLLLVNRQKIILLPLLGEVSIALFNVLAHIFGKQTKSNLVGKLKTWVLSVTIIICYLFYFHSLNYSVVFAMCMFTFFVQIIVLVSYFVYFIHQKSKKDKLQKDEDIIYRLFSTDYYLKHQ